MNDLFSCLSSKLCLLQSLDISQTNLDDSSSGMLCKALSSNDSLTRLNIDRTQISNCSKEIAAALRFNRRLIRIDMEDDMLDFEAVKDIRQTLKRNRNNREKLEREDNEKEKAKLAQYVQQQRVFVNRKQHELNKVQKYEEKKYRELKQTDVDMREW